MIVLFLCLIMPATAQTLEEKTFTNAKNYYAIKDYPRSFSYINFLLKLKAEEEMPEIRTLAESIYFNYLNQLIEDRDIATVETVKLNLVTYPNVKSKRIQQILDQTQDQIVQEKVTQAADENRDKELEAEKAIIEEQAKWRLQELELQEKLNGQLLELKKLEIEELARKDDILETDLQVRSETTATDRREQREFNQALITYLATGKEKDSGLSSTVIIAISVIGAIMLLGFIALILLSTRNSQQQQRYFEYSIRQVGQPREIISVPLVTAPVTDQSHLIEHKQDRKLLPAGKSNFDNLKPLIDKCRSIADEIDEVTNRKNATRNVAELVYKVSKYLGYEDGECMLFLAVALVYDIGFLKIDSAILTAKELSEDQYKGLQQHTVIGLDMINFVDPEFLQIFRAGISKHHENLDGSGYPDGIEGDDIPYIARVIHAVESFEAMTGFREFRQMRNKQETLAILKNQAEQYDSDILDAIDNVV